MEILYKSAEPYMTRELFLENIEKVSAKRREKIFAKKTKKDSLSFENAQWQPTKNQALSLAAGLILAEGLGKYKINIKTAELAVNAHGKPYLPDHPQLYFNLSHSGNMAIGIFDTVPVGIDIELVKERTSKAIYKYFTENERQFLQEAADEKEEANRLFRLWTHKESYFKAVGTGIKKELFEIECIPGVTKCVIKDGKRYNFQELEVDNDYKVTSCRVEPYTYCQLES